MAYIKKLVMYGFKSFPRKTEIPFDTGINVILGPNGSGKSNISDALCFVLGRLSIKSMRAAKAKNLIFLGTKVAAPSKEASVEIIFDNSDKTFSLDAREVSIKRIVRKNGQGIYKINNEAKTRQEVLTLLAQAGIDPNGFNIILQGEIQNFVRMHTEERRKVIEEVSGISIYEQRKEKSLRELEKTEEKLKEIMAILRERTAYLNNLEKERQQALKFKKLEEDMKRYKASIIFHDLTKKQKQSEKIAHEIENKNTEIDKIKKAILLLETLIRDLDSKISLINTTIQKSTGIEQEKLNQEIANIRAELAGLSVRQENYEKKLSEIEKQKQELQEKIREDELSLKGLQKDSPTAKKQKDLDAKKKELEELEEKRKRFYMLKSELKSVKEIIQDKQNTLQNYYNESDFLLKQIETLTLELFDKNTRRERLDSLKATLEEKKQILSELNRKEIELEKSSHTEEYEMDKQNKLLEKISKMDICPLCKTQITEEHIKRIKSETMSKIDSLKKQVQESDKYLNEIYKKREVIKGDIEQIYSEISKRESDLIKTLSINEKKQQIRSMREKIEKVKQEISGFEKRKKLLEEKSDENFNIEQKYETVRVEVQEISMRSEETINSEMSFTQREIERAKISLKQFSRNEQDINEDLDSVKENINEKEELLENKKQKDEELSRKFQKLISERDTTHSRIRENEVILSGKKNAIHNIEQEMNTLKIEKARFDAESENLETEMLGFPGIEIIKLDKDALVERLSKTQEILSKIGPVNLRSLEVYEEIKKEYDAVQNKAEIITKEKDGIMKVIHEIDIRKKKTFLKTLDALNEIFSRNFSQLSIKGQVSLELENRQDPFEGGIGIVVKTGHGKYFDVTSLSGGEQTLVALSLIFAIQEYSPYCFYILDEIDAALDKRNSERLASLLKRYMQKGQYIVITHNDEVITQATNLYGVSMHDGISKIISLRV